MADDDGTKASGSRRRPDPSGVASTDGSFYTTQNYCTVQPKVPHTVPKNTSELTNADRDRRVVSAPPKTKPIVLFSTEAKGKETSSETGQFPITPHQSNVTVRRARNREPEGSVSSSFIGSDGRLCVRTDPTPSVANGIEHEESPSIAGSILLQEEQIDHQLREQIGEIQATANDISSIGTYSLSGVQAWNRYADSSTLRAFSLLPSNVRSRLSDSFACYVGLGMPEQEVRSFVLDEIINASTSKIAPDIIPDAIPSIPEDIPVREVIPSLTNHSVLSSSSDGGSGIPTEHTEITTNITERKSAEASGSDNSEVNISAITECKTKDSKSSDSKSSTKYTEVTVSSTTPSSAESTSITDKFIAVIEKQNAMMMEMQTRASGMDRIANQDMEMIQKWKTDNFKNPIPKKRTDVNVGEWYENMKRILGQMPWAIAGVSMYDIDVDTEDYNSREYKFRSDRLCFHLNAMLRESEMQSYIEDLDDIIKLNDGIKLLEGIYEIMMPKSKAQILSELKKLGEFRHQNGETMSSFYGRSHRLFKQIKQLGYTTIDDLQLAFTQLALFEGSYKDNFVVSTVRGDIQLDKSSLKDYATAREFTDAMSTAFTNHGTYQDGKMTKVNATVERARVAGGGGGSPSKKKANGGGGNDSELYRIASNGVQLSNRKPSMEEVLEVFEVTSCPVCQIPKGTQGVSHWLDNCKKCKELGYHIEYDPDKDTRCKEFAKYRKELAAKNERKPGKALEAVLNGGIHPDVEKASGGGNTDENEMKTEVTSNTTKSKGKNKEVVAGSANHGVVQVAGLGRFAAIAPDESSSDDASSTNNDNDRETVFLPASTVVDKLSKTNSQDYLSRVITSSLCKFDYRDDDGRLHMCLSTSKWTTNQLKLKARIAVFKARRTAKHLLEIIPDSGATAHMLMSEEFFEGDYTRCEDVFVLMGDGTKIPVIGIGTARIKINGHVSRLSNALHVPSLDANLFSTTKHACNGSGCSFLLEKSEMHLSFPTFSVSQPIPADGDIRIPLQPLASIDWHLTNHSCDGIEFDNNVMQQIEFLNRVHFGRATTRAQKQAKLKELQDQFNTFTSESDDGTAATEPVTDDESDDDSSDESDDDDRFIHEGLDSNELRKYLGGITLQDVRDFMETHDVADSSSPSSNPQNPPPYYKLESSQGDVQERVTAYQLQSYFGGRQIQDFSLLSKLGTGIRVTDNDNDVPLIGSLVNRKRGRRKRKGKRATMPLEVVGMDVGYGADGKSIGGYSHVLTLVDQCTRQSWVYGMNGSSGADITEALWRFFIDAGGFPRILQCDFDNRIIGGKASALLRSHGTCIRAAPPHRQDKNGLVKRHWQELTKMARSFLADAKLPKKFWFWAIREANAWMNILPVTTKAEGDQRPEFLTTPFEAFYGEKPDYRILFPFGSVGAFRRVTDGNHRRTSFESQCMLGIALGRSEYTNGMVFYNPELDSFCTSSDFVLDKQRLIGEVFPSIRYDGGLITSVISKNNDGTQSYSIGERVYVQCQDTYDIIPATIRMPPTNKSKFYTVEYENGERFDVKSKHIYTQTSAPASGTPSISLGFFRPGWIKQDQKVTILHDDVYHQGFLSLDDNNLWEFVKRDRNGRITLRVSLSDLEYSWKMRLQENTFEIGWQHNLARRIFGMGRHVSAAGLFNQQAPNSLKEALHRNNPDRVIWDGAYNEEYDGLSDLEVFEEITPDEYREYIKLHGDKAKAIPSMNLFTIKEDKEGNPIRAKARIVVLGNLEQRIWSKEDQYAPVLSSIGSRLLVSMAIEDGRRLKQGDCKNAFCNGILPDDEICIVKPPVGCPRSSSKYWKLKKTLYCLARSAHHWYKKLSGHLKDDLG